MKLQILHQRNSYKVDRYDESVIDNQIGTTNFQVKSGLQENLYLRKNVLESDQSFFGFSNPVETEWWDLDEIPYRSL